MRFANYKLKGNTIVEVMIAMSILTFCSVLAVVIYINIQKSSLPFFKIKAVELGELYMTRSIEQKEFDDQTFSAEEFSVKRSVDISTDYSDCINIRILVFDGSKKKIHELTQLVFKGK
jgi:hypothetical protein